MPRIPRLIVFALLLATAAAAETPAAAPLTGFTAVASDQQRQLEARFDALIDPADLRGWMERLSARPHHLGSPWGKANAEFIAERFRSWGYDTRIETFHVLFPTPKTRLVEMIAPSRFTASLAEPAVRGDGTSGQAAEQLPIYNVYSADGDVTAELVYVNRGVPEDYEELERRGIDVKGKIAIARYGGSWRGIKPKVAAEHGAIGCIIYSDPRDDGYFQGDVYPQGGWRGERSAQRGSVNDGPAQYTGDPLTPGVGSTESAVRLPLDRATTLTKIPVLPISYADALPLLRALGGAVVPEKWRGGLPITYHFGPGPARVHLKLAFDWNQAPLHNVIATLPGTALPDQWVLRGNHHDAWVNGATDPVSGLVAMMAEAQAIGKLAQSGSRPRRTLVYAAWDGEEPGLLGSTEWVETHLPELRAKAVAYINSDSNSRGFLSAGGSHTLERLVNEVAAAVTDPAKQVSVGERARAYLRTQDDPDVDKRADFRLYSLGSGSDYTPFLQHAGIASLNIDYGGEEDYGQYHSIYDSFAHYLRFMDPEFAYGVTEAKTAGRLVLRLANADLLPFTFEPLADNVGKFVDEVMKLADTMRTDTAQRNERIRNRTFELAADPRLPFVAPQPKEPVPHLNFTPLQNALERLRESAKGYDQAAAARLRGEQPPLDAARALELERVLLGAERALTREQGLPQRPWYRHHLYAPGRYTGYSVKTLPGVREAIEQRRYAEAEEQIAVLAGVLEGFTKEIERATALVNSGHAGKTLEPGVLKVCLYPGFAPFVSKDGQGRWLGWDVSYLEDFAQRQGLAFQPVEVAAFNGIWNLAGDGKCDIAASGISDTPDRRKETGKAGTWSRNYYRVVRSFAVRAADEGKLNGIEDLRGKTVIVTEGSTADTDLRNRLQLAGIESVTIGTTADEGAAAAKVRDGGGVPFAYAGGLGSVELLVKELGGLAVAWPHCNMLENGTQVDEPFSFVVRAASSGLAAALDEYIAHPDAPYQGVLPDLTCPPAPRAP